MVCAIAVFALWAAILLVFGPQLRACWREPACSAPIVILESDDWGAGPVVQAGALAGIAASLARISNARGEHPVMTLGIVLSALARRPTADAPLTLRTLTDDTQRPILAAIEQGIADGVFTVQLHGFAHFDEQVLQHALRDDPALAERFMPDDECWTERLPDALQSSWVDGSRLPSTDLSPASIDARATRECTVWREIFGAAPTVAVPTTFVWSEAVERAWAREGVRVVVTPGVRYRGRDRGGRPSDPDLRIRNGELGASGVHYLVRNAYFEVSLGHRASDLLAVIDRHTRLARPVLVEIHRFNFVGPRATPGACAALEEALVALLRALPDVRFVATATLADLVARRDPDWIRTDLRSRLAVFLARAAEIPRFARVARWSGLAVPFWIVGKVLA